MRPLAHFDGRLDHRQREALDAEAEQLEVAALVGGQLGVEVGAVGERRDEAAEELLGVGEVLLVAPEGVVAVESQDRRAGSRGHGTPQGTRPVPALVVSRARRGTLIDGVDDHAGPLEGQRVAGAGQHVERRTRRLGQAAAAQVASARLTGTMSSSVAVDHAAAGAATP